MAEEPLTTPAAEPADAPQVDVDALQRERDEYRDRLLRTAAEFDNYRKRIEKERREQADRAVVSLLQDMLAIVDDFDLAAQAKDRDAVAYRKGVDLIRAKLMDVLRRQGVKPIDALGADFDPNLHEAVLQEVSPDHRENEVVAELRRGYTLHDRLLRPASVKVAKA